MGNNLNLEQIREKRAKAVKNLCLIGIAAFAVSLLFTVIAPALTLASAGAKESSGWLEILGKDGKTLAQLLSGVKTARLLCTLNLLIAIAGLAFCVYSKVQKKDDAKMMKIHLGLGGAGVLGSVLMLLAGKVLVNAVSTVYGGFGSYFKMEIKSGGWFYWIIALAIAGYYAYLGITIFLCDKALAAAEKSEQ